jgi:serine/threonine protein kinase
MEVHSGQHIGKYQVLEEIGRGNVGIVYKGYDPDMDRPVAIKVLAPEFAADQDFVQRFLHQARATAQLKHPHIVVVLDAGQQNGYTWMGMEYLNGISLHQFIQLQGPMLADEVQTIVRQMASVLDYVHRAGLLHGDVRAGNVIVCPPGRTLLTELGVVCARWEGQIASSAVSAAIAPEQVTGDELGPWTDLYALAVLAYELLGGQAPYASDTTAGLLSQIVHEPIPSLSHLRPDLPAAVGPVLETALAKDPHARYQTGAEFAAALEEALQLPQGALPASRPAAVAPAEPVQPPPAPAAPPPPLEKATPPAASAVPPKQLPDAHLPPPWESVPIRATPPPQPTASTADTPVPKITRLPRTSTPPSTPADRIARLRSAPAKATPQEKQKDTPEHRPPSWLWLLLGSEALLLLAGIVLIVLLVTGAL